MVMSFVLNDDHGIKRSGTKAEIEAEIAKSSSAWLPSRLPIVSWEEIKDETILQDRTFRNAWRHKGVKGKIHTDMDHAREIHRDRLRALRAPLLFQLDKEYLEADENGDATKKKEVTSRKRTLRDITIHPEIATAKTPEELKVAAMSILESFKT